MRPPRAAGGRTQRRRTHYLKTRSHMYLHRHVNTHVPRVPSARTRSTGFTLCPHTLRHLQSGARTGSPPPGAHTYTDTDSPSGALQAGHALCAGIDGEKGRAQGQGAPPSAHPAPAAAATTTTHTHTHREKQKHARTRGAPRGPGIRPAPSPPSDPMRLSPGRTLLQPGERWPLGAACGRPPPKPPAQAAPLRPRKAQTPDAAPRPRSRDLGRPLAPTRPGTRQDMATR